MQHFAVAAAWSCGSRLKRWIIEQPSAQYACGYGTRALMQTTMGRYKAIIEPRLRARDGISRSGVGVTSSSA